MAHAVFLGLGRLRQEGRGQAMLHSETLSQKARIIVGLVVHTCNPSTWVSD